MIPCRYDIAEYNYCHRTYPILYYKWTYPILNIFILYLCFNLAKRNLKNLEYFKFLLPIGSPLLWNQTEGIFGNDRPCEQTFTKEIFQNFDLFAHLSGASKLWKRLRKSMAVEQMLLFLNTKTLSND